MRASTGGRLYIYIIYNIYYTCIYIYTVYIYINYKYIDRSRLRMVLDVARAAFAEPGLLDNLDKDAIDSAGSQSEFTFT